MTPAAANMTPSIVPATRVQVRLRKLGKLRKLGLRKQGKNRTQQ
jgi:hypothetical protein